MGRLKNTGRQKIYFIIFGDPKGFGSRLRRFKQANDNTTEQPLRWTTRTAPRATRITHTVSIHHTMFVSFQSKLEFKRGPGGLSPFSWWWAVLSLSLSLMGRGLFTSGHAVPACKPGALQRKERWAIWPYRGRAPLLPACQAPRRRPLSPCQQTANMLHAQR